MFFMFFMFLRADQAVSDCSSYSTQPSRPAAATACRRYPRFSVVLFPLSALTSFSNPIEKANNRVRPQTGSQNAALIVQREFLPFANTACTSPYTDGSTLLARVPPELDRVVYQL
jgi:hypothetical protein